LPKIQTKNVKFQTPGGQGPCPFPTAKRGTCFYVHMKKTSRIHKVRFPEIFLAIRHVVSR